MNQTIVDVTTLIRWNRNPSGIMRVQIKLIQWMLENVSKEAITLVYFDYNESLKTIQIEAFEKIIQNLLIFKNFENTKCKPFNILSIKKVKTFIKKCFIKVTPNKYHNRIHSAINCYKHEGLKICLRKILITLAPNLYKKIYKRKPFNILSIKKVKTFIKKCFIKVTPNKYHNRIHSAINCYKHEGFKICLRKILITLAPNNLKKFLNFNNNSFELKENHIFISTGLDWCYSNFDLIFRLKQKIKFKFVALSYDVIQISHPEYSYDENISKRFFNYFYYLNYVADGIAFISDFSKNQFIDICDKHQIKPVAKFETIYLGGNFLEDKKNISCTNPLKNYHFERGYILYVSSVEGRKNHIVLLKAWMKANETRTPMPDLICIGDQGWNNDDVSLLYDQNIYLKSRIHFISKVSDSDLLEIYKKSLFCVFPSHIEGYGLGVSEALSHQKICLISKAPALVEAAQSLMPEIDAEDVNGWMKIISRFTIDKNLRKQFELKADKEYKCRTWNEFSKEFFKFVQNI